MAKAIPRLGRGRSRRALDSLKNCSRSEAIHEARKEIKKARALLRLARANISKKDFQALKKDLRKAAACLAEARDAAVRARTLRDLSRRFKAELPTKAFRKFRVELRRESDRAMRRFAEKGNAKSANRFLRRAGRDFQKLSIRGDGWKAIAPGVERAYRECAASYGRAVESGSAEDFHEWRKRAKDLWYQLLLLHPIWPEKVDRMICELETVGDILGEDHDLFMLQEKISELRTAKNSADAREIQALQRIIHDRQGELRGTAIAMGKYFYAEKPSVFCERLGNYWRVWRWNQHPAGHSRKKGGAP